MHKKRNILTETTYKNLSVLIFTFFIFHFSFHLFQNNQPLCGKKEHILDNIQPNQEHETMQVKQLNRAKKIQTHIVF